MSGTLNKVTLIGNVGKDPEIRTTSDGKEIAHIVLATSDSWKDKMTGERKERTEWHRIVIFNEGLANVVKNYVKKGSKLYIEGSLQTRKWVDQSGQEKYTTEIVLQGYNNTLTMLDTKGMNNNNSTDNNNGSNLSAPAQNEMNYDELDDEIPF